MYVRIPVARQTHQANGARSDSNHTVFHYVPSAGKIGLIGGCTEGRVAAVGRDCGLV